MKKKLITRITCDIDDRSIKSLIRCLKVFKRYGFTKELAVRPSPSGRGFHCIAWHKGKGVSLEKLIKIRRHALDDKTRCDLDEWGSGQRMINVLFTGKKRQKLKKGKIVFDKQNMQIETMGCEENVKISFGET